MPSSSLPRRRALLLVGALAVVLSLLVCVVGAGVVVALGSLSAPPAALAERLLPWLVAAALLALTFLALAAALGWLATIRLAAAAGDRLYLAALHAESRHGWAARLGLADRFAPLTPRDTDAVSRLQRRYVDGDLDEAAFERELDRLLEEGDGSAVGAAVTADGPTRPDSGTETGSRSGAEARTVADRTPESESTDSSAE